MGLDVEFYMIDPVRVLKGFGDDELRGRVLGLIDQLKTKFTVAGIGIEPLSPTVHPNLFEATYDLGYRYVTNRVRVRRFAGMACARGTGQTLWILSIERDPASWDAVLARLAPLALAVQQQP